MVQRNAPLTPTVALVKKNRLGNKPGEGIIHLRGEIPLPLDWEKAFRCFDTLLILVLTDTRSPERDGGKALSRRVKYASDSYSRCCRSRGPFCPPRQGGHHPVPVTCFRASTSTSKTTHVFLARLVCALSKCIVKTWTRGFSVSYKEFQW